MLMADCDRPSRDAARAKLPSSAPITMALSASKSKLGFIFTFPEAGLQFYLIFEIHFGGYNARAVRINPGATHVFLRHGAQACEGGVRGRADPHFLGRPDAGVPPRIRSQFDRAPARSPARAGRRRARGR